MDLTQKTVREISDGLEAKQFSAVELTEAYLKRIQADNERLNVFVTVTGEEALVQARATDERIARGKRLSVLDGVPCALKDNFNTKGVRTTCSSHMLERFVPPYDATVVSRLREAGVVFLGKANLDEFACGGSTEHSAFGPTKNPWDDSRVAGGSSGGSAAAVAAHMAAFALGTDTGGSIRLPASFCGIFGLKPTYGRVSRSGVTSMASSLDTIGPLTKTAEDAALVLQVIAGDDIRDATTPPVAVPDYSEKLSMGVAGLKVGLPKEYFTNGIDGEVEVSVRRAAAELEKVGAVVKEISLPMTKYAVAMYYIVMPAELSANLARFDAIRYGSRPKEEGESMVDYFYHSRSEGFGEEIMRRIMIGTYVLSAGYYDAYYKKALKVRTLIRQDFDKAFENIDVILVPTSPVPAFKIGENVEDPLAMYMVDVMTIPSSAAGIPSVSLSCGFTKSGLPIGMQIMGKQFDESLLFQVAAAYEAATEWHKKIVE